MSQQTLSRELALRIGLAARALPDTSVQHLMAVLTRLLGLPITEDKLASLNFKILKTEFPDFEEAVVKKAVHALKHPPVETFDDEPSTPAIPPYVEGEIPNSIRIACASNDKVNVDGHFGSCSQFMVYQVSATQARLIDVRDTEQSHAVEDDKNQFRAELIADCQVLYLISIGGPAAAKIVKRGIHPVKLPAVKSLEDTVKELQLVLAGNPPPWLAKVMGQTEQERIRFAQEDEDNADD